MSHHLNFLWLRRQSSPVLSILQTLALGPTNSLHTNTSQIHCNLQLPCPSSSSHNLKWMKWYPHNRVTCVWTPTVPFIISVFISHHSVQWRWAECFHSHNIIKLFCQKLCRWKAVNNAVSGAWSKQTSLLAHRHLLPLHFPASHVQKLITTLHIAK